MTKEGIERLFDFDEKAFENNFTEVAYNMVPYFKHEKFIHFYLAKSDLNNKDVKRRLVRKYQEYKSNYHLFKRDSMDTMLPYLFTVENGYHETHYERKLCASLPFTYLDWVLMCEISEKKIKIQAAEAKLDIVSFNILPNGETLLHKVNHDDDLVRELF